ncbi:MAG: hypothetical protein A2Z47_01190 [Thermodesulfovibrio sp. RBG_19FT_COMBO_42_12]|nr:MAG: hypothetical protein A2Z47_01190 [Thermodesulfovibrio sp. RBG_19FT_COMBO_42_12]
MPDKKNEKRKHKRFLVTGVHGNVLYPSDLEVLNISIDGAAIETSKRLELDRDYTLRIKYKGTILSLKGRVVWSILGYKENKDTKEISPVYRAGIRFTDTLYEKTNILLNFIEENKVRTFEKRLAGVRFEIATSEDVKIDYPYEYEVKKISLSGMLIETEYPLELNSRFNIQLFLNGDVLNIIGRVANCTEIKSESGTEYEVGIEFIEMPDSGRKLLKDFLDAIENT